MPTRDKALLVKHNREYRHRHPEIAKAHAVIGELLRTGKLQPQPCEQCGKQPAEAHHDDYSKPREVRWLCSPCHKKHHNPHGRTKREYHYRAIPRELWKPRPAPKRESLKARAIELRASYTSYAEIGRILGVSKGTVYKWLNRVDYD